MNILNIVRRCIVNRGLGSLLIAGGIGSVECGCNLPDYTPSMGQPTVVRESSTEIRDAQQSARENYLITGGAISIATGLLTFGYATRGRNREPQLSFHFNQTA